MNFSIWTIWKRQKSVWRYKTDQICIFKLRKKRFIWAVCLNARLMCENVLIFLVLSMWSWTRRKLSITFKFYFWVWMPITRCDEYRTWSKCQSTCGSCCRSIGNPSTCHGSRNCSKWSLSVSFKHMRKSYIFINWW